MHSVEAKIRRLIGVQDLIHHIHKLTRSRALANVHYGYVKARYRSIWDNYMRSHPRSLFNCKIVAQILPLLVRDVSVVRSSSESAKSDNAEKALYKELFGLIDIIFMLMGAVGFFKFFDYVGKWNEWVVFRLVRASGFLVTTSGILLLLILGW